jgi:nitrilase
MRSVVLAAVQAASVHLDRAATVEKACALIAEAGAAGADVIVFPEGFVPAHPCWFTVRPATDATSMRLSKELFLHSVEVPGPDTDALGAACRAAGVAAVVGVCERRAGTTGTMFNSQLFFDADGTLLGAHRKLMPTLAERIVHTGGSGDSLLAVDTHIGSVSALVCGENGNPLAVYALMRHYPVVHAASWPAFVSPVGRLAEIIPVVTRGLAYTMGCFVVNATGVLTAEMIAAYEAGPDERAFLDSIAGQGHASIVGPTGRILTEPLAGEGLVVARVDLDDVVIPKIASDYAGHYNRPDVFDFAVRAER